MPCLEISMPRTTDEIRQELATQLTKAFAEATLFPADIFGIRFHEYETLRASIGGKLYEDSEERPYLHMLLYCPRINRETKQRLVSSFTEVFVKVSGEPRWAPVIHICEHPYDNVGVDGQLLSDNYPELAERKFYYNLDD